MKPTDASNLAISALQYIAQDETQILRFLDLTGISLEEIRTLASEENFLIGVLEFIMGHESTLISFAQSENINPEDVRKAYFTLNPQNQIEF